MDGLRLRHAVRRHGGKSVSKAVLVASILPFRLQTEDNPAGAPQSAFDDVAKALNEDRAKFFTDFFDEFFGVTDGTQPVSDELLRWAHGIAMQAGLKPTIECMRSFSGADFRADLASFKAPTLIIPGTKDQTVPIDASARIAAKGIANAKLVEYDGAPHGLLATRKGRFSRDLIAFFKGG